jgi:hypothetical protein
MAVGGERRGGDGAEIELEKARHWRRQWREVEVWVEGGAAGVVSELLCFRGYVGAGAFGRIESGRSLRCSLVIARYERDYVYVYDYCVLSQCSLIRTIRLLLREN